MIVSTKSISATALKFKTADGEWDEVSYSELFANVQTVAKGLIALGIEHGDRVAIFSDTRPDWTLCDLATISIGAVVAPIYQTSSADEARHVLSDRRRSSSSARARRWSRRSRRFATTARRSSTSS